MSYEQAAQDSFRFQRYIVVARAFISPTANAQPSNKARKKQKVGSEGACFWIHREGTMVHIGLYRAGRQPDQPNAIHDTCTLQIVGCGFTICSTRCLACRPTQTLCTCGLKMSTITSIAAGHSPLRYPSGPLAMKIWIKCGCA